MVSALILSGGTGTRFGADIPKQYIKVNDKPIIYYCIRQLSEHEGIDTIQIVATEQWHDVILECFGQIKSTKFSGFSASGATRQLSIYNGLKDIKKYAADTDYILIHDAARPLLSAEMIARSLNAIEGHDGVLPVLPMKDTIYESMDGKRISALLDRDVLYAGQAPELFVLGKYYEANKKLLPNSIFKINGSTEPAVMAGMDIVMIPGETQNFKITTKEDLDRFKNILIQTQP